MNSTWTMTSMSTSMIQSSTTRMTPTRKSRQRVRSLAKSQSDPRRRLASRRPSKTRRTTRRRRTKTTMSRPRRRVHPCKLSPSTVFIDNITRRAWTILAMSSGALKNRAKGVKVVTSTTPRPRRRAVRIRDALITCAARTALKVAIPNQRRQRVMTTTESDAEDGDDDTADTAPTVRAKPIPRSHAHGQRRRRKLPAQPRRCQARDISIYRALLPHIRPHRRGLRWVHRHREILLSHVRHAKRSRCVLRFRALSAKRVREPRFTVRTVREG